MSNQGPLARGPSTRHIMVHPWLPSPAYESLRDESARRNLHPDVLAALLLDIVATENLFAAVLER